MSDRAAEIARDVAIALASEVDVSRPWSRPSADSECSWNDRTIVDDRGARIWFRIDRARLEIRSDVTAELCPPGQRTGHDYLPYGEKFPSISVSPDRSPQAIAKEIGRRLLPKLDPLVAIIRERKASVMDYEDRRAANITRLQSRGLPLKEQGERLYLYTGNSVSGDLQVYADTVSMSLRGLPVNIAEKIIDVVRQEVSK